MHAALVAAAAPAAVQLRRSAASAQRRVPVLRAGSIRAQAVVSAGATHMYATFVSVVHARSQNMTNAFTHRERSPRGRAERGCEPTTLLTRTSAAAHPQPPPTQGTSFAAPGVSPAEITIRFVDGQAVLSMGAPASVQALPSADEVRRRRGLLAPPDGAA